MANTQHDTQEKHAFSSEVNCNFISVVACPGNRTTSAHPRVVALCLPDHCTSRTRPQPPLGEVTLIAGLLRLISALDVVRPSSAPIKYLMNFSKPQKVFQNSVRYGSSPWKIDIKSNSIIRRVSMRRVEWCKGCLCKYLRHVGPL